jgi:hypothetical protein
LLFGNLQGPFDREDSQLLSFRRDYANGTDTDLAIYTRFLVYDACSGKRKRT